MTGTKNDGDPQLPWGTVISTVFAVALLFGGSWGVSQMQFSGVQRQLDEIAQSRRDYVTMASFMQFEKRHDELQKEIDDIRARLLDLLSRSAHDPVEGAQLKAIVDSVNERLAIIQSQIADINRQIAAAILLPAIGESPKKALVPQQ